MDAVDVLNGVIAELRTRAETAERELAEVKVEAQRANDDAAAMRLKLANLDADQIKERNALKEQLAEAKAEVERLQLEREPSREEMEKFLGDNTEGFYQRWTVNRCRHCKVPVAGGPTICVICAYRLQRDALERQLAAVTKERDEARDALRAYGAWQAQEGRALGSDRWQDSFEAREKRDRFVKLYKEALAPTSSPSAGKDEPAPSPKHIAIAWLRLPYRLQWKVAERVGVADLNDSDLRNDVFAAVVIKRVKEKGLLESFWKAVKAENAAREPSAGKDGGE